MTSRLRRSRRIVVVVTIAALGIVAGIFFAQRSDRAPSGDLARLVVGFGDSIAAGQGQGPAGGHPNNPGAHPALVAAALGWRSENFAIATACSMTKGSAGADPATPATCDKSIVTDQLPKARQLIAEQPGLIVVMVGANDVQFSHCGIELLVPAFYAGNPCKEEVIGPGLAVMRRNLQTTFGAIKKQYPRSPMVVSLYYNPMPGPPAAAADVCPLFEPVVALRKPLSLISDRTLANASAQMQAEVYEGGQKIVERLNATIRAAAQQSGAVVAAADFTTHDLCRTQTGGSREDVWIYGPDASISFSARVAGPGVSKQWRFTLPSACKDLSQEPEDVTTNGPVTRVIAGITVTYDVRLKINCMPHPTLEGQQGLAAAVLKAFKR